MEGAPQSSWQRYVVYREKVYAVDEKVLVGNNEHQAFVARPVRAGDDTVLVRWESTKKEEEVAIGDVKKIDLDAKRPRRKRRDASAAQTEASAPARREPPRKRRKKTAERSPSVAEIRAAYRREQEIDRHMKALQSGNAEGRRAAEDALIKLAFSDANCTVIAKRLVRLLSGGSADDQWAAAKALWCVAHYWAANRATIVAARGIEALVALVRSGVAGGQAMASRALRDLVIHNDANQVAVVAAAIVAAGGIEALSALRANGSHDGKFHAKQALEKLGPAVGDYVSKLHSENASLKRRLGEEDVVDLCGDGAPPPAKKNALRDEHDRKTQEHIVEVKKEKADAEGARDRTDAIAAAASVAAATATADAREATEELEDVHDDFVNPLTLTVNALQTKIDELHALARQVDPVAADAIKNRQAT